jgi:hypothetical protein
MVRYSGTRTVYRFSAATAEIAQIEETIDNVTATYASAGMSAARYAKTVAKLEATQAAPGAPQTRPEEVERGEGSDTVSQRWNAIQDRNAYLRAANIKIYVQHHEVGGPNSFEHDLMGLPEMQAKVEPPDDENITNCLVHKDGIITKLYLGDLRRTALRETPSFIGVALKAMIAIRAKICQPSLVLACPKRQGARRFEALHPAPSRASLRRRGSSSRAAPPVFPAPFMVSSTPAAHSCCTGQAHRSGP